MFPPYLQMEQFRRLNCSEMKTMYQNPQGWVGSKTVCAPPTVDLSAEFVVARFPLRF